MLSGALCVLLVLVLWGVVKFWTTVISFSIDPFGEGYLGPLSIDDLVTGSDAIAKGRITGHENVSGVIPPVGTPVPAGMVAPPSRAWSGIREAVVVVDLAKDDGAIGRGYVVGIPGTVPTNVLEWVAREASVWPAGRVGETYLDFLEARAGSGLAEYGLGLGRTDACGSTALWWNTAIIRRCRSLKA